MNASTFFTLTGPLLAICWPARRNSPRLSACCASSAPEGLIGFKLQALTNDPRRTQDLADIRALIRANRSTLKMDEVREFFRLFDREALLEELLNDTE